MRYLVTFPDMEPYLTRAYQDNDGVEFTQGMVVYDLDTMTYTDDGENWTPIKEIIL